MHDGVHRRGGHAGPQGRATSASPGAKRGRPSRGDGHQRSISSSGPDPRLSRQAQSVRLERVQLRQDRVAALAIRRATAGHVGVRGTVVEVEQWLEGDAPEIRHDEQWWDLEGWPASSQSTSGTGTGVGPNARRDRAWRTRRG